MHDSQGNPEKTWFSFTIVFHGLPFHEKMWNSINHDFPWFMNHAKVIQD
jgi:hypothetical protein